MSNSHTESEDNPSETSPQSGFPLLPSPKVFSNYKSKPPEETLQWIQDIIQPYFPPYISVGLQPNEFCSTWFCRLSLVSPYLGQNGKGTTIPLALASGFAEVMERLQALYVFRIFSRNLPRLTLQPDTLPDKSIDHWKEFNSSLRKEMRDCIPENALSESEKTMFYRFYDLLNKTPVYLDKTLAYTPFLTTGTAAGNTREEAVVQALCELFERYTTRVIIENRIVVPSIPWDLLSEPIQKMLSEIENTGVEVSVKDFSLQIGLPAVCVVVGNSHTGYHARPGCAPDLNVAVTRCVLEYYQGVSFTADKLTAVRESTERWKKLYSALRDYVGPYFSLDDFFMAVLFTAYEFPPHELKFLTEDSLKPFTPWGYSRTDFYEEIQLLLDLCRKNQFRIYARAIDWMGFPAVQVLSPDLKGHEYRSMERWALDSEELKQFQHILLQGVDSIRTQKFYELLKTPEVLFYCMQLNPPQVDMLRGLAQEGAPTFINHWYFLGHVAYYFKDIPLATSLFRCYSTFDPEEEYFYCVVRFLELLPENPWGKDSAIRREVLESVRNELCKTFSPETVERVLFDLRKPLNVLDDVDEILVPCRKCEGCPVIKECTYGRLNPLLKRLQNTFSEVLQWEENPQVNPCP